MVRSSSWRLSAENICTGMYTNPKLIAPFHMDLGMGTPHRCGLTTMAPRVDLFLERAKVFVGRPVQQLAGRLEARAVTRTIPRMGGIVPPHQAAQMRAHRRKFVHRAVLVTIDRNFVQAGPHDGAAIPATT